MRYPISSEDYLQRARWCLDQGPHQFLFYAAFELRCGIESRLREYLDPHDHVTQTSKKEWRIDRLGRAAERAFNSGDCTIELALFDAETKEHIHTFYYTPVSSKFRKMAQRLGELLHAPREFHPEGDDWWVSTRSYLEDVYTELKEANRGDLIGPPLRRAGTYNVEVRANINPDTSRLTKQPIGSQMIGRIRHLADGQGERNSED